MKLFVRHSLAVALAAASPLVFTQGAYAAKDYQESPEEVIITASPFAKSEETVSHPVNVLGGDELRNAASATLGETLNGELGVSSSSFGPGVGLPVIRGQSDNRVKVMQDSIGSMDASAASPDHAVTLEPLLATRIEVLRGPAALRYGPGAIGGVVNVLDNRIPEKLPDQLTGGAELRNSSVNDETVGVVSLTGANGPIALHIDGVKRDSDDMEIPGYGPVEPSEDAIKGTLPNTNAKAKSGSLGASYIGEGGFIGLSVNKQENNYGVPPDGDEIVRIDMEQTRYDLKGELRDPLPGFDKLTGHLGHADYQHTEIEYEAPEFEGEAGTRFTNDAWEGRVELLHHHPDSQWQGAVGIQGARSTFAAIGEEAFIPKSDISSGGVFVVEENTRGQFTYELGARGDFQQITPEGDDHIEHHSLNLSGNATWHFTPEQKVSLGLAQAQRAPSVEELLANGPHPATGSYLIGDENLEEETSTNLELGYHWHGEQAQFALSGFYNQFADFIYARSLGEQIDELNAYEYTQADATFRGWEAELTLVLSDTWQLRLFSDSVRAKLDEGGDLPRITPIRAGSELSFDQNNWSAGLTVTHAQRQDHPGDGETETASYTKVDARLSYSFSAGDTNYTLFTKASNLTDEEIRNATSYLRNIAPEAGRNLQVGLRVGF
jgi:iron complex outermembrane recepter protein